MNQALTITKSMPCTRKPFIRCQLEHDICCLDKAESHQAKKEEYQRNYKQNEEILVNVRVEQLCENLIIEKVSHQKQSKSKIDALDTDESVERLDVV